MKIENYKRVPKVSNAMSFSEMLSASSATGGGVNITKDNALKNSSVIYSCINLISSTIASMPIHVYKNIEIDGRIRKERVYDLPICNVLKNRPNEYMTSVDFISSFLTNLYLYGNSYALMEVKSGQTVALKLLDPSVTSLEQNNGKGKWFVKTTIDQKQVVLQYENVVHIRDLSSNGIEGVSRLESILKKATNLANASDTIAEFIENGNLKGIIKTPDGLNDEAKKSLKERFKSIVKGGSDNTIGVLDESFSFDTISGMSMIDAQFIDSLAISRNDIIQVFNISPSLLGDSGTSTNSNMVILREEFIRSLITIISKLEQEINYKCFNDTQKKDHFVKLNMDGALRGNLKDRTDVYIKQLQNSLKTVNDVLALEDENDIGEIGDKRYRSLNYVDLEIADAYQLSKAGAKKKE